MKLRAKATFKNAYDQVLFLAGAEYEVVEFDGKRYWILNELHTETPVRVNKVEDRQDFETV